MRILSALVLLVIFLTVPLMAGDVSLAWDPPAVAPGLAGYKVYFGTRSRNYDHVITIGNQTTYTVEDLEGDVWFFAVTAFDDQDHESGYSNEIFTVVSGVDSPDAPENSRVTNLYMLGPFIIDVTGTTVKMSWKTSRPCISRIEYSHPGGTFSSLVVDNKAATDHFVRLTDLDSGEKYSYEIFSTDTDENMVSSEGDFWTK